MLRRWWVMFGSGLLDFAFGACSVGRTESAVSSVATPIMRLSTTPSLNLNGWEFSGKIQFQRAWLGGTVGGVVDLDGHYGSVSGTHVSADNFLFGPELSWSKPRFSPFAPHSHRRRATVWGAAGSTIQHLLPRRLVSASTPSSAMALIWRVVQVRLSFRPHFFSDYQNNARVSTGLVFHFWSQSFRVASSGPQASRKPGSPSTPRNAQDRA